MPASRRSRGRRCDRAPAPVKDGVAVELIRCLWCLTEACASIARSGRMV